MTKAGPSRKEGSDRAGGVYPTKDQVLADGRQQAQREKVELVIHGKDGTIQDSDSYGRDPFPPRGWKR